jgi:flagellin
VPGSAAIDVQVGVNNNANDRISVSFNNITASIIGISYTNDGIGVPFAFGGGHLNSTTAAQAGLGRFDAVLSTLSSYRSIYGASQNRLESVVRNLSNYTENLQSAKSRVLDADFAHETAQLAKFQILQQSGVAVLGQANAVSQAALRLLG